MVRSPAKPGVSNHEVEKSPRGLILRDAASPLLRMREAAFASDYAPTLASAPSIIATAFCAP
jgi:hypothetical protein